MRLVSARWVLPISAPPIEEGAVIVADAAPAAPGGVEARPRQGTIIAVGTRADLRRVYPGLPEWRAAGALLPALVNAHAHLELSGLGGMVPGGDGVVGWTRRLGDRLAEIPIGAVAGAAGIATSAAQAANSARAFGTGAIGDVGNGVAGWVALRSANLEGVFFHELVGSREARTGDALADAMKERAAVVVPDSGGGGVHGIPGIPAVPAAHAPYSVSPDLLRRIFVAAAGCGQATTIHLAEDRDEVLLLRDGSGAWPAVLRALGVSPQDRTPHLSPTAYLERLGAFATARPPLLVHMVHADDDDRRRARQFGCAVVLCPRSNLHIGGQLPDVPAFIKAGVHLALGTDSLASVADLSPWEEVATLAEHFPDVDAGVWLQAATTGGARALGLHHLGALAPGKSPGLLDVEMPPDDHGDPRRALVTLRAPLVTWVHPGASVHSHAAATPTQE